MNESATPVYSDRSTNPLSSSRLLQAVDGGLRRVFDFSIALVALIVLSPFFLLIAFLVKRDSPGPVFFWGERIGRGGRPFQILKFRTMYERPSSYAGPRVTGSRDGRITPIGRWLRDTKLNELPQLWNVLKGDMSLVGPRPEDRAFVVHWPDDARATLLSVRPGITSPASVLYRDEEKLLQSGNVIDDYLRNIMPSKLRLDLLYVHHRHFFTDLDVLFWTVVALLPRLKGHNVPEHLLFWGPLSRFVSRYFSWFVLDSLSAFVAIAVTGIIWRTTGPLELGLTAAIGVALAIALIFSLVNAILGMGRVVWSRAGMDDALVLVISTAITTLILLGVNYVWRPRTENLPYWGHQLLPAGMIVIIGVLSLAGFVTMRYRMRIITGLSEHWITLNGRALVRGERVLIVGAAEMGDLAVRILRMGEMAEAFTIVGMVDDSPRHQGARIKGLRVIGATEQIPALVQAHDVGLILFAIDYISPVERARILATCEATGAQTIIVPDLLASLRANLTDAEPQQEPALHAADALPAGQMRQWLEEVDDLLGAGNYAAARDRLHDIQACMEKTA